MIQPMSYRNVLLDALDLAGWPIHEIQAEPGRYAVKLSSAGNLYYTRDYDYVAESNVACHRIVESVPLFIREKGEEADGAIEFEGRGAQVTVGETVVEIKIERLIEAALGIGRDRTEHSLLEVAFVPPVQHGQVAVDAVIEMWRPGLAAALDHRRPEEIESLAIRKAADGGSEAVVDGGDPIRLVIWLADKTAESYADEVVKYIIGRRKQMRAMNA